MKRLTRRSVKHKNHVYFSIDLASVCRRHADFCTLNGCEKASDRSCPYLQLVDRLAAIEDILGADYDMDYLRKIMEAAREDPKPLTVKELRQMEGEPVWVKIIDASNFCWPQDAFDDYGLVRKSWVRMWDRSRADLYTVSHHFEEYGKTWLAYRNKPKEAVK